MSIASPENQKLFNSQLEHSKLSLHCAWLFVVAPAAACTQMHMISSQEHADYNSLIISYHESLILPPPPMLYGSTYRCANYAKPNLDFSVCIAAIPAVHWPVMNY